MSLKEQFIISPILTVSETAKIPYYIVEEIAS